LSTTGYAASILEIALETFDYFQVLRACFNLLMRKHMLLKVEPKEIMTGIRARKEDEDWENEQP